MGRGFFRMPVGKIKVLFALGVFLGAFSDASSFKSQLDDFAFKKSRSNVLLVWQRGQIIYQKYSPEWSAERPHLTWSMSKSFLNLLLGVAVKEKKVALSDSVCDYLKTSEKYCSIRIIDLLNFSSGLSWDESYERAILKSSPVSMFYGRGRFDYQKYILNRPHSLSAQPGSRWMYSSGDSNLLSKVLQKAYGQKEYDALPWSKIAKPLGLESLVFEQESTGLFVASSYLYLSAQDTLTWGRFMLQGDGRWKGQKILPENWIQFSQEVPSSFFQNSVVLNRHDMGAKHWWVNQSFPKLGLKKAWAYVPEDFFAARGHWGQLLGVVPSKELVMLRYGFDKGGTDYSLTELLRHIMQLVDSREIKRLEDPGGNPQLVQPYNPGLDYGGFWGFAKKVRLFSTYRAKEFCSCLYVMGQSESYCKKFVENAAVPSYLAPIWLNDSKQQISVNAQKARFVSRRLGCQLVP